MVRNAWGEPLNVLNATVFVQTTNGIGAETSITPTTWPGVNYVLQVPMDAAITPEPYTPTALRPAQPLQLKVRVGNITYLPLEMALGTTPVGNPGGATRLDLTLGEDSDLDGLPDA
jgi:hypothetical protein